MPSKFKLSTTFIAGLFVINCAHSSDSNSSQSKKTENETASVASKVKNSKSHHKSNPRSQSEDTDLKISKKSSQSQDQVVVDLLNRYKSDVPVLVKIRKRIQSPYLAKEKVSTGILKLGHGIFRLDLDKPDNSTMVLDGKNIWLESRIGMGSDQTVQVSKFALNETRRANAVFAILFDDVALKKGFDLKHVSNVSTDLKKFTFEPKKVAVDYKTLSIVMNPKTKTLASFSYQDDLENIVVYDFGKTEFNAKISQWQLEYTPPKGVVPSEY